MEPEVKSNGALIGLVIVVLILIIGGIYMWQVNKNADMAPDTTIGQNSYVTDQDAASVDQLDKDAESVDSSTGVDVNAVN
ncbi:MAG TPA: hypothetical protein VGO63_03735 [Candidatus Paceibacterota bacterium]|jgi:hypothetical protein|nr:hypothetical protein [Candidatus Paceibacterota bacterium]